MKNNCDICALELFDGICPTDLAKIYGFSRITIY